MIASAQLQADLSMQNSDRALLLVIDDDEGIRKITREMLEARGYRVLGASSVGEGLRLFAERHPAAVLLDPATARRDRDRRPARAAAALPGHPGGGGLRLRQRLRRGGGDAGGGPCSWTRSRSASSRGRRTSWCSPPGKETCARSGT